MNLICYLKGHRWEKCICGRCGLPKSKDEVGHTWDGCICTVCGTKRNKGHKWEKCICGRCGLPKSKDEVGHTWDGCICTVCGTKRNKGHKWDGIKCSVCGHISQKRCGHDWKLEFHTTENFGDNLPGSGNYRGYISHQYYRCTICGLEKIVEEEGDADEEFNPNNPAFNRKIEYIGDYSEDDEQEENE